jgi:hypothetical protein
VGRLAPRKKVHLPVSTSGSLKVYVRKGHGGLVDGLLFYASALEECPLEGTISTYCSLVLLHLPPCII